MNGNFMPYYIRRHGSSFAIYRWTDESKTVGNRQELVPNYELAKKRTYELNGMYLKQLKFNCK